MPLPDKIALVLQGGGALGAYQAGVYEALVEHELPVHWVAGISIGAVNAALIAGNAPEERIAALSSFWGRVTGGMHNIVHPFFAGTIDALREWEHLGAATGVASLGAPGFFTPNSIPPLLAPDGSREAVSLYDTAPLVETLDELVDWERLNDGPVRVSVGAVDIETGNFRYFDNRSKRDPVRIDVRHIMASGALPPGLPPVEIDGRHYWDGGLVSNTPLAHVLERQDCDMLVFQVDLFPARGEVPTKFTEVLSREKDIRFSSRTRAVTDRYLQLRKEHEALRNVLSMLPPEAQKTDDVTRLKAILDEFAVNVVHLIYKAQSWETGARDFEFSRATMDLHWGQGVDAVATAIRKGGLLAKNIASGKTDAFDLGLE